MLLVALSLTACFQGLSAVQWTSAYRNTTKICPRSNLTLGWNYRLEPGETVEDIKWLFAPGSRQPPSVIGSYMYGFLNSAPSYGTRLTHRSNGTVVLVGVTSADTGTYTVEVISRQTTGSFSTIRRDLVVTVADPSTYSSNAHSLNMEEQAVPDAQGELHIRLTCGPLAWRGEPPVDVIWVAPSGAELNSTGYEDDSFHLVLNNPVESGVYTCGLPASATPALCLRPGDPLTGQAIYVLVDTAARLALLEANLQQVEGVNFHLMQQLQQFQRDSLNLTQQFQQIKGDNLNLTQQLLQVKGDSIHLTQQLQRVKGDDISLAQQLQQIKGDNLNLSQRLQQVKGDNINLIQQLQQIKAEQDHYRNRSSARVGFHAKLGNNIEVNHLDHVKFNIILYNEGGAYNSNTGDFTAPLDGTYFVSVTVSPYDSGHRGNCDLTVDTIPVATVFTSYTDYFNPDTAHAVISLVKGSKVWVSSWGSGSQFYSYSVFSGFLVH